MNLPPHRGGACNDCDGLGVDIYACESDTHDTYDDNDECPACPECEACEGAGDVLWDWYPGDGTICSDCGAEGVDTMGYGEDGEEGQVCLACYLAWHARECGCGAWPKDVAP